MVQSLKCLHTNNGIGISTNQNKTVKVLWNESNPAAYKISTHKCWQKVNVALTRMPATWGDGGLSVP